MKPSKNIQVVVAVQVRLSEEIAEAKRMRNKRLKLMRLTIFGHRAGVDVCLPEIVGKWFD